MSSSTFSFSNRFEADASKPKMFFHRESNGPLSSQPIAICWIPRTRNGLVLVVDDSDARPEIFLAYDKSRDASMSEKIPVDSLAWLFENSIDVLLLYFGNFVIIHNSLFVLSYAPDKVPQ